MSNIPATAEAEDNLEQTYDAGDEESVSKARKKGGRNRRARLEFVEAVMQQPQGRKWFYELMEKCNMFGNPVVQGDEHMTYFRLGEQNIGKMILSDVQQFPELYVKMIGEAKEDR